MRMLCATGLWVALLTMSSPLAAETTFPYQATISGSDVYVRSGPGKNYYPTDKLQRGTVVEVYRHDPGGWSAIRPPADAFSWVAGEHLRLGDDDIAEVVSDEAVAFVGSRFRDVHDVRQVKLDQGEAVRIVGEKRLSEVGEKVAQTWYKISPPAGEFRWVYGKLLIKQQDADAVASDTTGATRSHEPTPIDAEPAGAVADFEPTPIDLEPEAAHAGGEEVIVASFDEDNRAPTAKAAEPAKLPRNLDEEHPVKIADDGDRSVPRASSNKKRTSQGDLDVDLSLIVAEEPADWNFTELRTRAQQALADAESALLRGRARLVLREIKRYEAIQAEYFEAEEIREETDRRNENIEDSVIQASAEEVLEEEAARPRSPEERYDGIGRLTPVRSKRIGAPPFALTDEQGRVKMFVTPAPGLQLGSYVGQVLGISGIRSYLPELKTPHVTAKRAELLEEETDNE